MESQARFNPGAFGGGHGGVERGDPPAEFCNNRAPWGNVFEKHVTMRDPDPILEKRKLIVRADVGVVVSRHEIGVWYMGSAELVELGDRGRSVGDDLGVEGVSVHDQTIGAVEKGAQHGERAQVTGAVVEVKVGDDARNPFRHGGEAMVGGGEGKLDGRRWVIESVAGA